MSGNVAASISCMLAKNFTVFKQKMYIASNFTGVIVNTQLHHVWDAKKVQQTSCCRKAMRKR